MKKSKLKTLAVAGIAASFLSGFAMQALADETVGDVWQSNSGDLQVVNSTFSPEYNPPPHYGPSPSPTPPPHYNPPPHPGPGPGPNPGPHPGPYPGPSPYPNPNPPPYYPSEPSYVSRYVGQTFFGVVQLDYLLQLYGRYNGRSLQSLTLNGYSLQGSTTVILYANGSAVGSQVLYEGSNQYVSFYPYSYSWNNGGADYSLDFEGQTYVYSISAQFNP